MHDKFCEIRRHGKKADIPHSFSYTAAKWGMTMQPRKIFEAERVLSEHILETRQKCQITRRDLAQQIGEKEQAITKYETGGFVPLPSIEALGEAFGAPVEKKLIRRISFLRKLEKEKGEEQLELISLYRSLFSD